MAKKLSRRGAVDERELCAGVPESVRPLVSELVENVNFMYVKLHETRKGIENEAIVIPYDNGGGQTGIRENPAFKGYQTLLASYRKTLEQLMAVLNRYGAVEKEQGENPLAQILAEAEKVLEDAAR